MRQADFNRKRDIMFAKEPRVRITDTVKKKLTNPQLHLLTTAVMDHPLLVHYMANPKEPVVFNEVQQFTEAIDEEKQ